MADFKNKQKAVIRLMKWQGKKLMLALDSGDFETVSDLAGLIRINKNYLQAIRETHERLEGFDLSDGAVKILEAL
jgi:hypothetical protein